MSNIQNVKILVFGFVNGNIEQALAKAKAINTKHGPFDALICLGSFFGSADSDQVEKLLSGQIKVPFTTYFHIGQHPLPPPIIAKAERGEEICSNLFYLGKSGILSTTFGVNIAFLGGVYNFDAYEATVDDDASTHNSPYFNKEDITALLSSDKDVDILLTNEWPADVCQLSSQAIPANISESLPIQQVARRLRPRYHFAPGPFFEREPFKNVKMAKDEFDPPITRFVSLANFGSVDKQRWFYAFNISVSKYASQSVNAAPSNTTASPYEWSIAQQNALKRPAVNMDPQDTDFKRPKLNKTRPPETYLCKQCEKPGHWLDECEFVPEGYACRICQGKHRPKNCPSKSENRERSDIPPDTYICNACGLKADHYLRECPEKKSREKHRRKPIGPEACFFCLSNPNLEKHLIVSIAEESYVALAKGPLTSTSTNPSSLPFSGHALIIPIAHTPNLLSIPEESRLQTVNELVRYRDAISKMYQEAGCAAVTIEISRSHAVHAHWQIHPVSHTEGLEEEFHQAARTEGFEFQKQDVSGEITDYIRVYLPDGVLSHIIPPHSRFDLQFGRRVLCNYLKSPERIDWRSCTQTQEEEKREAEQFKTAFKPYDFS